MTLPINLYTIGLTVLLLYMVGFLAVYTTLYEQVDEVAKGERDAEASPGHVDAAFVWGAAFWPLFAVAFVLRLLGIFVPRSRRR